MKGVILAAGIGSRLRPLTLHEPKCCVTIGGSSILARQLHAYADAEITDVTVVAGYLADEVRALGSEVADECPDLDVTVLESEVYANTDNMYSLSLVREAVAGEAFVLSNGDAVFDAGLLADLVAADARSAVACDPGTYTEEAMKVTVDDDGSVSHVDKDVPENVAHAISNDVYRFSADFSEKLFAEIARTIEREGNYAEWTELAIDRVVRNRQHDLEPVDVGAHSWVEIDDADDLAEADLRFSALSDLASMEAVFFDLDGTVLLDDELVDDADRVIDALQSAGVEVFFLTNNSSKWKDDYARRLSNVGVSAAPEDVLLSTDGVIDYLRSTDAGETYVLGTETMREALADHGITVANGPDREADEAELTDETTEEFGDATPEELGSATPEYVVVGFDTELTYEKAREATLAVRDGATFLLAHPDTVCPTAAGFVPDAGSIAAMIERATDQRPARVFGKPNAEMIDHVLDAEGYAPEDVLVVGDRLETDVALAENVGCDSVCVLTGDATRTEVELSDVDPTLVAQSIGDLTRFLDAPATADASAEARPQADGESDESATPTAVKGGDST